jgi:hypothetical protein
MELFQVSLEAHGSGATIYITGLLAEPAAARTGAVIDLMPGATRVIRLDLRAVELIDPAAFVSVARALNRWRDARFGRVTIEFPARSRRRAPHLHLVRQPSSTGIAVNTAMSCPMSTSPG